MIEREEEGNKGKDCEREQEIVAEEERKLRKGKRESLWKRKTRKNERVAEEGQERG